MSHYYLFPSMSRNIAIIKKMEKEKDAADFLVAATEGCMPNGRHRVRIELDASSCMICIVDHF